MIRSDENIKEGTLKNDEEDLKDEKKTDIERSNYYYLLRAW